MALFLYVGQCIFGVCENSDGAVCSVVRMMEPVCTRFSPLISIGASLTVLGAMYAWSKRSNPGTDPNKSTGNYLETAEPQNVADFEETVDLRLWNSPELESEQSNDSMSIETVPSDHEFDNIQVEKLEKEFLKESGGEVVYELRNRNVYKPKLSNYVETTFLSNFVGRKTLSSRIAAKSSGNGPFITP